MADPDRRTGSRNIGGGVVFKVRSNQIVLAASFGTITKADPLKVEQYHDMIFVGNFISGLFDNSLSMFLVKCLLFKVNQCDQNIK